MNNESWLLLLFLAAMSGITPETMQKMKEEDEKVKEYADWCPARKTECGTGTTYQICMKTGEGSNRNSTSINDSHKGGYKMICITKDMLMGHIAGWLYSLAPKNEPRKVDIIMRRVGNRIDSVFDAPFKHDLNFKIRRFKNRDDLYQFTDELIKNIKEFRELNLTWEEYENGVDVDSPDRENTIVFTSMYDRRSSEDWYTKDFIDLDAFVQNVVYTLCMEDEYENGRCDSE